MAEVVGNNAIRALGYVIGDVTCIEVSGPGMRHTISRREAYRLARDLLQAIEDAEEILAMAPTSRGQEMRG